MVEKETTVQQMTSVMVDKIEQRRQRLVADAQFSQETVNNLLGIKTGIERVRLNEVKPAEVAAELAKRRQRARALAALRGIKKDRFHPKDEMPLLFATFPEVGQMLEKRRAAVQTARTPGERNVAISDALVIRRDAIEMASASHCALMDRVRRERANIRHCMRHARALKKLANSHRKQLMRLSEEKIVIRLVPDNIVEPVAAKPRRRRPRVVA